MYRNTMRIAPQSNIFHFLFPISASRKEKAKGNRPLGNIIGTPFPTSNGEAIFLYVLEL